MAMTDLEQTAMDRIRLASSMSLKLYKRQLLLTDSGGKDFVNHKDGNKQNNRACNLEWVTREENMIHAYSHGLKKPPAGEKNGRAKLSYENVQFIKDNYKKGDKERGTKALSEKFGVARQTVSAVISGQNW